jgi:hypothetical protein
VIAFPTPVFLYVNKEDALRAWLAEYTSTVEATHQEGTDLLDRVREALASGCY